MNKFELFSMIFYVLDAEWDESKNPTLGRISQFCKSILI